MGAGKEGDGNLERRRWELGEGTEWELREEAWELGKRWWELGERRVGTGGKGMGREKLLLAGCGYSGIGKIRNK